MEELYYQKPTQISTNVSISLLNSPPSVLSVLCTKESKRGKKKRPFDIISN